MNFVERELYRIVEPMYPGSTYAGSACYVSLGGTTRAKLHIRGGCLTINILDCRAGVIDQTELDFSELWTAWKQGGCLRYPGIFTIQRDHWDNYQPSAEDYQVLSDAVGQYLEVFREPEQTVSQQWEQTMG